MRLAISNISWDTPEDESIATLLQRFCIDAIDVDPSKYFAVPNQATNAEIRQVRQWRLRRGIEITSLQALLFGTDASRNAMIEYLTAICHIGSVLGAPRLFFGSPKNCDRSSLSDREAIEIAVPLFSTAW